MNFSFFVKILSILNAQINLEPWRCFIIYNWTSILRCSNTSLVQIFSHSLRHSQVMISKFAQKELINSSQPHKKLGPPTNLHNSKSIVMPVNHKFGSETSKQTHNHAYEQKRDARRILNYDHVIASSKQQQPE